jgi:hypothetical protein
MKRTIEICRTHKYGSENIKHQLGFSSRIGKAEETTSFDEWDLRWNFNIENKLGVGWHQYSTRVSSLILA